METAVLLPESFTPVDGACTFGAPKQRGLSCGLPIAATLYDIICQ